MKNGGKSHRLASEKCLLLLPPTIAPRAELIGWVCAVGLQQLPGFAWAFAESSVITILHVPQIIRPSELVFAVTFIFESLKWLRCLLLLERREERAWCTGSWSGKALATRRRTGLVEERPVLFTGMIHGCLLGVY